METNKTDNIRDRMNMCGKSATPFFFALNFEMTDGIFIENPLAQDDILFEIRGKGNKSPHSATDAEYHFAPVPTAKGEYEKMFSQMRKALENGIISVVNLTMKTPIATDLSLLDIFMMSTSLYQVYLPNRFVCFSPEQFIKIERGKIYTNPMKGTIDASIPNAQQVILEDEKEKNEHSIVVRMVQEELKRVAKNIKVERFRYLDHIKTQSKDILQTSSEISGTLPSSHLSHLGDIVFKMLPASSILGVPKNEAQRLIRDIESEPRGYYTGICGYFDGEVLNSGVLIRFIEQEGDKLYFRSGGGVTINSNATSEYQEILTKIYLSK